jgi:hypothetical protein
MMKKVALVLLGAFVSASCATAPPADQIPRISPRAAHERAVHRGALLVCAYRAEKCPGTHLAGSITLEELESRLPVLGKGQEIILFCG